eukprot:15474689-Alexandrium_andersonii.AAC.1
MAEVLQLLGDGGVEVQQLLAGGADLGPEAFGCRGLLSLSAPNALDLARTGGKERLPGGSNFTDGTALGLKLGPGLNDQARDRLTGALRE